MAQRETLALPRPPESRGLHQPTAKRPASTSAGSGKGGKRLSPSRPPVPRRGEQVREDRPGVKYVDPESTDTGETEVGTASVAPRIADVYPEPPGTGATEGYSRGHDSRSGRATTLPASSIAQGPNSSRRSSALPRLQSLEACISPHQEQMAEY